ncbi:dethiobiotin synthase [Paracoccus sp. CPCC 101403]|uniref:ATP-dependent dethiobiotin synthetase BioD n=2 Tax=Paracoccus broussonetiae TaxID=3075834 RepID=A0ABU3ECH5_9RHOB|nr:dethiobiotin synthase [Paracoccus sp. CPCC 101403]MDT1061936.1 dethiobiotin synthase [Paracoccus sp. CPCC 101403]
MTAFVVTGTDTGIGKTMFSAGLTARLGGHYWKPVQSGLDEQTDSEIVAELSGRPVLPEAWRLRLPASPHIAAAHEGVTIDIRTIDPPPIRPLVIEGAGGLMVPLDAKRTFLDLFATWGLPVILCARTALGTINHSLLSLAALRRAGVPVHGIAFVGAPEPEVEATIERMGQVRRLGRLDWMGQVSPERLTHAFDAGFPADAFRVEGA